MSLRTWFAPRKAPQAVDTRLEVEQLEQRSLLDAAGFVQGLYGALMQRPGSPSEVDRWVKAMNAGISESAVIQAFINSDERAALLVQNNFSTLLGRRADSNALNYFTAAMRAGATNEQIRAQIMASDEYFTRNGANNSALVNAYYRDLFNRAGDAAGTAYWSSQLGGANARAAVLASMMGSIEYQVVIEAQNNEIMGPVPEDRTFGPEGWVK